MPTISPVFGLTKKEPQFEVKGTLGMRLREGVFDIRTYSLEMMKVLLNEVIWARSTANHSHVKLAAEHLKTALNEVAQRYNKLVTMKGEIPQCGSANQ